MFDDTTQAVTVCCHNNFIVFGFHFRYNGIVPVGQNTFNSIFQRFSKWKVLCIYSLIVWILKRRAWIFFFQWSWWHIVAATPNEYLLIAIFSCCFSFVQPL